MATPPLRPDDPDAVAAATFGTSFRGYDPDEVRRLLTAVAAELSAAQRRVSELEAQPAAPPPPAPDLSSVDEAELMRLVGEETARVLEAARLAATERAERAEREAADAVAAAEVDAERIRASAEEVLGERTAEAEAEAERIRADTLAEQMAAREEMAREHHDAAELAQSLIDEAEIVRERILAELARRRGEIRRQIEQLRAGRERLLAAYGVVRRTLEEASTELTLALPEARAAAENAGRGLPDEVVTVEQLERELEAARLVGLPILDPPGMADDDTAEVDAAGDADGGVIEAFAVDDADVGEPVAGDAEGPVTEASTIDGAGLVDLREISAASRRIRVFGPQPPPEADALPREPTPTLVPSDELEEVRVLDGADDVDEGAEGDVEDAEADGSGGDPDGSGGDEVLVEGDVEVAEADGSGGDPDGSGDDPDGSGRDEVRVEGDVEDAGTAAVTDGADGPADADHAGDEDGEDEPASAQVEDAVEGGAADHAGDEDGEDEPASAQADDAVDDAVEGGAADGAVDEDAVVSVDDLFARIRSSRAERVARAHEVLGVQPPVVDDDDPEGRAALDRLLADSAGADPPDGAMPEEAALAPDPTDPEAPDDPAARTVEEAAIEPAPTDSAMPAAPNVDETRASAQRRAARDEAVEAGRVALARLVKRALADDQSELLDAIRRGEARSGIEVLLPPPAEHRGLIAAAGIDLLSAAARAGAESAGDPEAAPVLDALADRLGVEVTGPIRDRVERGVAEVGDDADELLDVARAIYRDVRSQRLAGIVEAALAEAFQIGVFAATEPGSPIRWVVDDDGSCGPDCDDNALAGVVAAGEAFPTGHRHPPAHASCRCVTVSAG